MGQTPVPAGTLTFEFLFNHLSQRGLCSKRRMCEFLNPVWQVEASPSNVSNFMWVMQKC